MDAEIEVTFSTVTEADTATIGISIEQFNIDGTFTAIWQQTTLLDGAGLYTLSDTAASLGRWDLNRPLRIRTSLNDAPPNTIVILNVNRLQVSLRNQTRYQRRTEPLSVYARGEGVVPETGAGGGGTSTTIYTNTPHARLVEVSMDLMALQTLPSILGVFTPI